MLLKLFVLLLLITNFVISYVEVEGINKYLQYIYGLIMFVCVLMFFLSFFANIRKIAYVLFGITLICYISMNSFVFEIWEARNSIGCLEAGDGVWDYDEHRCRTDCWKWDKEHGCYKE